MLFTGHIVAWYPVRTGCYLGRDWKYMDMVAVAAEPRQGTQKYDRVTFRAKNNILDELLKEGALEGGSVYTFNLEMDSEEYIPRNEDGTVDDYKKRLPRNQMPILKGFGQPFQQQS